MRIDLETNPHYRLIGGATAVRQLVDRFYHHMDTLPQARAIRAMHPDDLAPVKETLFRYLSGWLGGPALFTAPGERPRLRHRHLRFAIGDGERDAWMRCMVLALEDTVRDPQLRAQLERSFFRVADSLRNRRDGVRHDHEERR